MNLTHSPRSQQGVTLIIGLIMLVLITLMVVSAFTLSVSNLQSVGNMQFRNEAIAAASKAIEAKIGSFCPASSPCTSAATAPAGEPEYNVDLRNGAANYKVVIATPTCISRSKVAGAAPTGGGSSVSLGLPTASSTYNTVWDIDATVSDDASGASVRVRQGMRMQLSQAQCNAVCAPAAGIACS